MKLDFGQNGFGQIIVLALQLKFYPKITDA
jgi:hypothetical protein